MQGRLFLVVIFLWRASESPTQICTFAQFFFKVTEKFAAELQEIDNHWLELTFFVILQRTFCTETNSQKICKLAEKFLLDVLLLNFLWFLLKLINQDISTELQKVDNNWNSLIQNFLNLQKIFCDMHFCSIFL